MKNKLSIIYLKITTLSVMLATLALLIFILYIAITAENIEYYRAVLFVISASIVPLILGAYYFLKLLIFVAKKTTPVKQLSKNLDYIKYSAFAVSAIYIAGMPIILYAAEKDDAPGVVLIALIIIAIFFTVGVFVSVVQNLLQERA